jgi:hypothetical protein
MNRENRWAIGRWVVFQLLAFTLYPFSSFAQSYTVVSHRANQYAPPELTVMALGGQPASPSTPKNGDQVAAAVYDAVNGALKANATLAGGSSNPTPHNLDQVMLAVYDSVNGAIRINCVTGCSGSGGSLSVNSSAVSNPNLNASAPSPDSGYTAITFKVSSSNVIGEIQLPTLASLGGANAALSNLSGVGTGSSAPLTCSNLSNAGTGCSNALPTFATLAGGTNTAAAMTVGSGASLTFAGTGTVNAGLLNGAAVASGVSAGTNSSGQVVGLFGQLYPQLLAATTGVGTSSSPFVNTTDNAAGVQTQLAALSTGGVIKLSGYQTWTTPVTLTQGGTWLDGQGKGNLADPNGEANGGLGTIVNVTGTVNGINVAPSPISGARIGYGGIRDIFFWGGAISTNTGIQLNAVDQFHIDNVIVSAFGTGIALGSVTSGGYYVDTPSVTNSTIQGAGVGISSNNGISGYVINSDIAHNNISDNTGYSIILRGTTNHLYDNDIVRGCGTVANCSAYGAQVAWLVNDGSISGNSFQSPGECWITNPVSGGCTQNTSSPSPANNLYVSGTVGAVTGNQFAGVTSGSYHIYVGNPATGYVFSGNTFDGTGTDYYFSAGAHDNIVQECNVTYVDAGARNVVCGYSTNAGDPEVAGNWAGYAKWQGLFIRDTTHGITYAYYGAHTRSVVPADGAVTQNGQFTVAALATPAAPTVTPTCASSCTTSWAYKIVAIGANSTVTAASTAGSTAAGGATLGSTVYNTITLTPEVGANLGYKIYRTTAGTSPATTGLITTLAAGTYSYVDQGAAGDGTTAPTTDSGTGNAAMTNLTLGGSLTMSSQSAGCAQFGAGGVLTSTTVNCGSASGAGISGTPTNGQIAQWVSASSIQGVNATGAGAVAMQTTNSVSFSGTPTFNAALGNLQAITLTGNVTSSTLSNCASGQQITFQITEDSTGGRTFVWPTNVYNAGPIDITEGQASTQAFTCDGSGNAWAVGPIRTTLNSMPVHIFLDFLSYYEGGTGANIGSPSGGGSYVNDGLLSANHPGLWQIASGSVSGAGYSWGLANNNQVFGVSGSSPHWTGEYLVYLASTTSVRVRLGALHGSPGTDPNYGNFFVYDSSVNGNWHAQTSSDSGHINDQDTGIAVSSATWYRLRVDGNNGTLTFYVNGVLVATSTTDLPSGALGWQAQAIALANSASVTLYMDSFEFGRQVAR